MCFFEFFPIFPWPWKKTKKTDGKIEKKTVIFFQAFKTLTLILSKVLGTLRPTPWCIVFQALCSQTSANPWQWQSSLQKNSLRSKAACSRAARSRAACSRAASLQSRNVAKRAEPKSHAALSFRLESETIHFLFYFSLRQTSRDDCTLWFFQELKRMNSERFFGAARASRAPSRNLPSRPTRRAVRRPALRLYKFD